jgi:hypothetical protein
VKPLFQAGALLDVAYNKHHQFIEASFERNEIIFVDYTIALEGLTFC